MLATGTTTICMPFAAKTLGTHKTAIRTRTRKWKRVRFIGMRLVRQHKTRARTSCWEIVVDGKVEPPLKTGKGAAEMMGLSWLPPRDSNPDNLLQRQVS